MLNNNNEQVVALGFSAKEFVAMLDTKQANDARKSLAYFKGEQEEELIKKLNEQRSNWREKKMNPRFYNITKMVVEKSAMIFKDTAPKLAIFDEKMVTQNKPATELLYELFSKEEFSEFWHNFDEVLRLMNTALVLVQWNNEDQKYLLDILYRGNCEVILSPINRKVIGLIYQVADNMYQVYTEEEVIELTKVSSPGAQMSVAVTAREVNPYGLIPVTPFYDTNAPISGFWVEQDKSLVNLNEMVNLHLTDSEYSLLWSKMSTLFTNMLPAGHQANNFESIESVAMAPGARVIPRTDIVSNNPAQAAGPGAAVVLTSPMGETPFLEYKNPQIDLVAMSKVVDGWIRNEASAWSVRIEVEGQARAASGFQFLVEEMPNLDLRKQRQKMFESGFKRMYRVLRTVFNTAGGVTAFPEASQLFAQFEPPRLPVDLQQRETVWEMKIAGGRATELDYLQEVEGISREEAEKRFAEIVEFQIKKAALLAPLQPVVTDIPGSDTKPDPQDDK